MKPLDPLTVLTQYFAKVNIDERIRPPPDCPQYRLSEVISTKKGRVPGLLASTFNESAKPYINIKAFEQGVIEHYVVSGDGVPVSDNDLVIVWDGARCGLIGQGMNGILGSTLKKLSLKPAFQHVPMPYLRFFLQKNYYYLNTHSRGSVIQHVDQEIFWKLKIPIPSEEDERFQHISQLVDMFEAVEKQTSKQLELIRDLKKSFLQEAFTPKNGNPQTNSDIHFE